MSRLLPLARRKAEAFLKQKGIYVSGDQYELEADNFATGLLMPEELFRKKTLFVHNGARHGSPQLKHWRADVELP